MEHLIRELKSKIISHRSYYDGNEAVRRQLVEPVLDHIGCKTDNPNLVRLNSQTEEKDMPDYVFLRHERIQTYIQAKRLAENQLIWV